MLPQASPVSLLSPRRVTRRSLLPVHTPVGARASPARPGHTPGQLHLSLEQTPASKSRRDTPRASQSRRDTVNVSLCFLPVMEVPSEEVQSEQNLTQQSESVSVQEEPEATASVEEDDDDEAAVTVTGDLPLSPTLPPSPVLQAPEPPSALSFLLSPSPPPISSPAVHLHVEAQQSECVTSDGSIIEVLKVVVLFI